MKLHSAFAACLMVMVVGCSKEPATPMPAGQASTDATTAPAPEIVKYRFDLPGDAIVALRLDPTNLSGESIGIRRIALVTDQGTQEMDACAPKGVQRVRIASASAVNGLCRMVVGIGTNPGWIGLSTFGSLPAAQQPRHLDIEVTRPKGKGPIVLFDTGTGYNFKQSIPGAASAEQAAAVAATPSGKDG